jgi:hypothetical protein
MSFTHRAFVLHVERPETRSGMAAVSGLSGVFQPWPDQAWMLKVLPVANDCISA